MLRFTLLLAAVLLVAAPVRAQVVEPVTLPPPEPNSLDDRLFHAVYDEQNPIFEATMRGVNGASVPVFLAAVPVHGLTMLATGESGAPTGRLFLSQAGAIGGTFLIKTLVQRARPFVAHADVETRQRRAPGGIDPFSFPSGHAATSFALATSFSLSYPEWYVIVPALTWSSLTALARVWHGMHYPSDIVIGSALGASMTMLVHVLFADGDETGAEIDPGQVQPAFTLRIPIQ
ncbi:MAG: phosphatase PAP2 family protein [Rhodothermaceae bacterium]|nr:phosphatase PAP2 family protein [Rhodothermaceae bacterium]